MAEILGAASAASQLLDGAFTGISKLRKAVREYKDLPDVLKRHNLELESIKSVIRIVESQSCLHTSHVRQELVRLRAAEEKLLHWVRRNEDRKRSVLLQVPYNAVNGSKEVSRLTDIMHELSSVKSSLCLDIQVASIGVIRDYGEKALANAVLIESIDNFMVQIGYRLKIAELVETKPRQSDGTVVITQAELASLSVSHASLPRGSGAEQRQSATHGTGRVVIIDNNRSEDQALMISMPVDVDLDKDYSRIEITNCTAAGDSVMVNRQITKETFRDILANRAQIAAAKYAMQK